MINNQTCNSSQFYELVLFIRTWSSDQIFSRELGLLTSSYYENCFERLALFPRTGFSDQFFSTKTGLLDTRFSLSLQFPTALLQHTSAVQLQDSKKNKIRYLTIPVLVLSKELNDQNQFRSLIENCQRSINSIYRQTMDTC